MQAIQLTAAVYLLFLIGVTIFMALRVAITGRKASGNLDGFAALAAFLSIVVVVVTTLVEVG